MAIKKQFLVEKRNVLNEMRANNMTLQELRFFSIYLSKINARDISTRKVKFSLDEFGRIMGFNTRGAISLAYMKSVTNGLLSKVVNIRTESGGYDGFQLFKKCRVDIDKENQNWYVEIDAHDDALSLMFDLKRDYFAYELWNALRLRSSNQVRMYEILKQYEKIGERTLSIPELRNLLGIGENEYPEYRDFKKRVLDSCQIALDETTDIKYSYVPIRGKGKGGKIIAIRFTISKNENYIDQLTLAEFLYEQPPSTIIIEPSVPDEVETHKNNPASTPSKKPITDTDIELAQQHVLWEAALLFAKTKKRKADKSSIMATYEHYAFGILRNWIAVGYKTEDDLRKHGLLVAPEQPEKKLSFDLDKF